jgi:hypothetical protein
MLELPGLQVLRGDPRWPRAEERLRDRIARDGTAPSATPQPPR